MGIQGFYTVSGDRPDEDAILFVQPLEALFLLDDPAVSVIPTGNAPRDSQWQRPVDRVALFVIPAMEGVGPFTITAYDANGEVIALERFDPPTGAEARRAFGDPLVLASGEPTYWPH
jgi:hypothetical protein